jgi:thiol:disulfide interchange protein DsbD
MNRRALIVFVAIAVLLTPSLALAGNCVDGAGTGKFQEILDKHGAVVAVLASFGFGFLASLTPCVYPMVPITVSIFGATEAKSRWRAAGLSGAFVLGIATLFTPMGILSAVSGRLMGSSLSSTWVVLSLALLFAALAASMFGAFELALPSSLANKLSSVGGVGFKGAFVMGLVMGLIAAPCTGPFLTGMITVIATSGKVALGAAALFAFALGLGVLFFLAGAFAVSLPKGGAWMMGIKWVSGVALATMSFVYLRDKFEPVHSLVQHPGYAFGATAFAVLLLGAAFGIVHVLAERRKSPIARLSKPMKLASIVPAVCGAAMFFSWAPLNHSADPNAPKIAWLTNEEEALAKAAAEHKPMMIDFGATWCHGCEELDRNAFADPMVRAEAQKLVTLRIDATNMDPDDSPILKKYGVKGLPVVLFLDRDGVEVGRFNREVPADTMVVAMKCNLARPGKSAALTQR